MNEIITHLQRSFTSQKKLQPTLNKFILRDKKEQQK